MLFFEFLNESRRFTVCRCFEGYYKENKINKFLELSFTSAFTSFYTVAYSVKGSKSGSKRKLQKCSNYPTYLQCRVIWKFGTKQIIFRWILMWSHFFRMFIFIKNSTRGLGFVCLITNKNRNIPLIKASSPWKQSQWAYIRDFHMVLKINFR